MLLLYVLHSSPVQGIVLNMGHGSAESFQVLAGDGHHDVLWVVDANGLKVRALPTRFSQPLDLKCVRQAHFPVIDRLSNTIPPLVAQYHPKRRRSSVAAQVFWRKTEEAQEMDTMELDTMVLPADAMGRLWGTF